MPLLLSLWKTKNFLFLVVACHVMSCSTQDSTNLIEQNPLKVDTIITTNSNKLVLTKDYCEHYYGFSDYKLNEPKMIVVHYTAIPTLKETLQLFKKDYLATNRGKINKYSNLNVGIHYVVDKDGSIYNLTPDSIITRHLIGFNHVSLGIENIAKNEDQLTPLQIESNAKLIQYLSTKYPSIIFLIGHSEYDNKASPHYKLLRSLDENYQPYPKQDPGSGFMFTLRKKLKDNYELEFQK